MIRLLQLLGSINSNQNRTISAEARLPYYHLFSKKLVVGSKFKVRNTYSIMSSYENTDTETLYPEFGALGYQYESSTQCKN